MSDPIDRAITLFEHGRIEEAAHLLAVERRSAVDANEEERLAEIDDLIAQMEGHLSAAAVEAFNSALADENASTQPHRAATAGGFRTTRSLGMNEVTPGGVVGRPNQASSERSESAIGDALGFAGVIIPEVTSPV